MINIEKSVTRDNLEIGKKYYGNFFDDFRIRKEEKNCIKWGCLAKQ